MDKKDVYPVLNVLMVDVRKVMDQLELIASSERCNYDTILRGQQG